MTDPKKIDDTFKELEIDPAQLPPYQGAEEFGKQLVRKSRQDSLWVKSDTGSGMMIKDPKNDA